MLVVLTEDLAQFSAPMQQLTTVCNCSSRRSNALFWPLWTPEWMWSNMHVQANIYIHKIKINLQEYFRFKKEETGYCTIYFVTAFACFFYIVYSSLIASLRKLECWLCRKLVFNYVGYIVNSLYYVKCIICLKYMILLYG